MEYFRVAAGDPVVYQIAVGEGNINWFSRRLHNSKEEPKPAPEAIAHSVDVALQWRQSAISEELVCPRRHE